MTKLVLFLCVLLAVFRMDGVSTSVDEEETEPPYDEEDENVTAATNINSKTKYIPPKPKAVQYNILQSRDVFFPEPFLGGPTPFTQLEGGLDRGYTFSEWVQLLGFLAPDCSLAPVRTLKELYIINSLIAESVPNANPPRFQSFPVLVGVFKDAYSALDCRTFGYKTECLSNWQTFFGPVTYSKDLWAKDDSQNIHEPDGGSFNFIESGDAPATVGVVNVGGIPALSDNSGQIRYPFAATMCILDKHSSFANIPNFNVYRRGRFLTDFTDDGTFITDLNNDLTPVITQFARILALAFGNNGQAAPEGLNINDFDVASEDTDTTTTTTIPGDNITLNEFFASEEEYDFDIDSGDSEDTITLGEDNTDDEDDTIDPTTTDTEGQEQPATDTEEQEQRDPSANQIGMQKCPAQTPPCCNTGDCLLNRCCEQVIVRPPPCSRNPFLCCPELQQLFGLCRSNQQPCCSNVPPRPCSRNPGNCCPLIQRLFGGCGPTQQTCCTNDIPTRTINVEFPRRQFPGLGPLLRLLEDPRVMEAIDSVRNLTRIRDDEGMECDGPKTNCRN